MKRTVLITGAAGGFGKALAAEYAQRGHDLLLTDISQERLETLAAGLRCIFGSEVLTRPCDLTDPGAIDELWRWIGRRGLRFSGLLNVAGIDHEGRVDGAKIPQLLEIVRVNVEALVNMSRRILDFRDGRGTLRIVNVSSLGCFCPMPLKSTYAAAKRFVYNFSIALNEELRDKGVRVMVVCPAGMPTTAKNVKSANQGHGILGLLTEKNVGWVARRVYEKSLRGQTIYIPGWMNFLLGNLSSLVPEEWKTRLIGRRWERARQNMAG